MLYVAMSLGAGVLLAALCTELGLPMLLSLGLGAMASVALLSVEDI